MNPPPLSERRGVLRLSRRTVNWDDRRMVTRGRKRRRRHTAYAVRCACGHRSYLKAHDAVRDTPCKRCQTSAAGRRGWQAAWADPGSRETLIEKLAAWQRQHPSQPEQTVRQWLEEAGVTFETQTPFDPYGRGSWWIPDFTVQNGRTTFIQVHGPFHDPDHPAFDARTHARDQALAETAAAFDITLITLDNTAIASGEARARLLAHFA